MVIGVSDQLRKSLHRVRCDFAVNYFLGMRNIVWIHIEQEIRLMDIDNVKDERRIDFSLKLLDTHDK